MKITKTQLRQIIREEARKKKELKEVYVPVHCNTAWECAILLTISLAFVATMEYDNIKYKAKEIWSDIKLKRKISPKYILKVISEFEDAIKDIKEPGKRRYFTSLINKIKRADPEDKDAVVSAIKKLISTGLKPSKELQKMFD